jgi:hypothetical protein
MSRSYTSSPPSASTACKMKINMGKKMPRKRMISEEINLSTTFFIHHKPRCIKTALNR